MVIDERTVLLLRAWATRVRSGIGYLEYVGTYSIGLPCWKFRSYYSLTPDEREMMAVKVLANHGSLEVLVND